METTLGKWAAPLAPDAGEIIDNRIPYALVFRAMAHIRNQMRKYPEDVSVSLRINTPLHEAHSLLHRMHTLLCEEEMGK